MVFGWILRAQFFNYETFLYLPLHVEALTNLEGFAILAVFGVVVVASAVGAGALLSPLANVAGGGATTIGILAMGIMALIGVPLFARWHLSK